MKHYFLIILSLVLFMSSCSKEEDTASVDYSQGTFVVNQGTFGNGTGTITYINGDQVVQEVFEKENGGNVLGNVVQSMVKLNNKYFIAINNGAAIEVVDAKTFKSIGKIEGIDLPRYFAIIDDQLYISSWNTDFSTGKVSQINPNTLKVTGTININGTPEKMLIVGDQIYVTLATIGAPSNRVIVIDSKTNTIIKTIVVGDNPHSLAKDKNGDVWVSCSGNTDYVDPSKSTDGSLNRLQNDVVVQRFNLKIDSKELEINQKGDQLYFLSNGNVIVHSISDQTLKGDSIYEGIINAIGIEPSTDKLYLAKGDFVSSGKAVEINTTTKIKKEIPVGIGPGFFYFSK